MTFDSINQLLSTLIHQSQWPDYQLYLKILKVWPGVVSQKIQNHTKLLGVNRGVLWLEVSNPSWANELMLGRYQLLTKLNQCLTETEGVKDLKIMPRRWLSPAEESTKLSNPWLSREPATCPQCQGACSQGEIQRWQQCRYCQIKHWQRIQGA
jgi:predicted nucleic acid-binding Zn ribbon protein